MIWTRSPTNFDSWEAELQFRVTGRGRIGADGLAFWYTATKGFEGPVSTLYIFGTTKKWIVVSRFQIIPVCNITLITGFWQF